MESYPPELIRAIVTYAGDEALLLTCHSMLRLHEPLAICARIVSASNMPTTCSSKAWTEVMLAAFELNVSFNTMLSMKFRLATVEIAEKNTLLVAARMWHARRFAAKEALELTEKEQEAFVDGWVFSNSFTDKRNAHAQLAVAINTSLGAGGSMIAGACVALASCSYYAVLRLARKLDFDWWRFMRIVEASYPIKVRLGLQKYFQARSHLLPTSSKERLAGAVLAVCEPEEAVAWLHIKTWVDASRSLKRCWIARPAAGVLLLTNSTLCRAVLECEPNRFFTACNAQPSLAHTVWSMRFLSPGLQAKVEINMFTSRAHDCLPAFDLNTIAHWSNVHTDELLRWTYTCLARNVRKHDVSACWEFVSIRALPFFTAHLVSFAATLGWHKLHAVLTHHMQYQHYAKFQRSAASVASLTPLTLLASLASRPPPVNRLNQVRFVVQ